MIADDRTAYQLADQAIGLFLEYRDKHGYPEEEARRAAAVEVAEGTAADLPGDPVRHRHSYQGQTLIHTHGGGGVPHGYYGHPEDPPEGSGQSGEYERLS